MIERLPYTLSKGVIATRIGLEVHDEAAARTLGWIEPMPWRPTVGGWGDVAEQLRYQEGEPWCKVVAWSIKCFSPAHVVEGWYPYALHRLAAILCDDAEAFRVLHWCVHNLGGDSDD